jgi:hypothetical protein
MSLTIREVRNPVKRHRAERIRAALQSGGDIAEYAGAGAIAPTDSVAILRPTSAGEAMTLADGTIPGEAIRIEMQQQDDPTFTAVVTPVTFAGGATLTFDAVFKYAVLIWVTTNGWTLRTGDATVA